jgi:DNA-binding LacI/PurR family transcriptional regulator
MKSNKPTSFDIAFRAGGSQPTVSRALRNSPRVNKDTRERVQAIAKKLNYKVDINAQKLRSKESKTLALLFSEDPGSSDTAISPFFLSMLGNITRTSSKRGYDLLICFQHYSDNWGADCEDTHKADGIIFLDYGDYLSYIKKIAQLEKSVSGLNEQS